MRPHRSPVILVLFVSIATGHLWLAAQKPAQPGNPPQPAMAPTTTQVSFVSEFPVGIFRISSLIVEPSGKALDTNIAISNKKMELAGVTPATLTLPNGDYAFNIGSTDDFNRMIVLKAEGQDRVVTIHGNPMISRAAGIFTSIAGSLALICSPSVPTMFKNGQADLWGIISLSSGTLAISGGVVWILTAPWIDIK